MISLRFFNFRSRGYLAAPTTIEHCVRWLTDKYTADEIAVTVRTFLKRKVCKAKANDGEKARQVSDRRLAVFKKALVADFDAGLQEAGAGEKWFAEHVQPVADRLRAEL